MEMIQYFHTSQICHKGLYNLHSTCHPLFIGPPFRDGNTPQKIFDRILTKTKETDAS